MDGSAKKYTPNDNALVMSVVIYNDCVVQVLKLTEMQKWRAELLESLETAATERVWCLKILRMFVGLK